MTTSFTQRQDCVPREHRVHDAGNYIIDIYTHTKELPNVMTVPCLCSARHDSARTVQTLFANLESVSSVRQFVWHRGGSDQDCVSNQRVWLVQLVSRGAGC